MNESSTSSQPTNREKQLDSVRLQLRSPQPSSVKAGMDQVRKWLQDYPEDRDTFQFLMDALAESPTLREDVRNLVQGFAEKGSIAASEALNKIDSVSHQLVIPNRDIPDTTQAPPSSSTMQDLMSDADDAYYAAEFERAVRLYRKILRVDPANKRALQQLDKAILYQHSAIASADLPREAIKYHRQARSYIAAEDFQAAIKLLTTSVEIAQNEARIFPKQVLTLN